MTTSNSTTNNKIKELQIVNNDKTTIFDDTYLIPIYQRAFSWGENEISQLLDDIFDFKENNYYLGSLIVKERKCTDSKIQYEVIDGQQRLTALYLILTWLDFKSKNICHPKEALSFEHRPKSIELLQKLTKDKSLILGNIENNNFEENKETSDIQNNNILAALDTICKYFGKKIAKENLDQSKKDSIEVDIINDFVKKLRKTKIFRIQVPEKTDLNKYFEIMNTRGEQLEQHEIIKARLIECLKSSNDENDTTLNAEQILVAKIWDACQEMDEYIQMNFADTSLRTNLFGENYSDKQSLSIENFAERANGLSDDYQNNNDPPTIDNIIDQKVTFKDVAAKRTEKKRNDTYYESIIDFPYFLLHVLKIYKKQYMGESISNDQLDCANLKNAFDKVCEDKKDNEKKFAKEFIVLLLNCRYLFDNFFIKRKFDSDDNNNYGKWSLELFKTNSKNARSCIKTFSKDNILMLQACLRVSITAPKGMHWITNTLCWLYEEYEQYNNSEDKKTNIACNNCSDSATETENKTECDFVFSTIFGETIQYDFEQYIETLIKESASPFVKDENYNQGVETPHIVFNYLDYLLWKALTYNNYLDDLKQKVLSKGYEFATSFATLKTSLNELKIQKNFNFEYRNSVEHFFPRNPEVPDENWSKDSNVHMFGNLCLLGQDTNAKFSNLNPKAKIDEYGDKINTASLKLRLMKNLINQNNKWTVESALIHQDQMIALLNAACGIEDTEGKQ